MTLKEVAHAALAKKQIDFSLALIYALALLKYASLRLTTVI